MGQDTVELRPAYVWDCPKCQAKNWVEGVLVPPDLLQEVADSIKIYDETILPPEALFEAPFEVVCQVCKVEMFTKQVVF